jgi:hypothetical protein
MTQMGIIERNFGTDFAVASWLYFVSAILYSAALLYAYLEGYEASDPGFYKWTFLILFLASLFWIVGSAMFIYVSYPDVMDEIFITVMSRDPEKWSFSEKYFTGNTLLVATWMIVLGFLPYYEAPIYGYAGGYIEGGMFALLLICLVIATLILALWVYSTFPTNMRKHEGKGSSYFFDTFCCLDIACDDRAFLRQHLGSDFTAASWFIAAGAFASVPVSIITVAYDPSIIYILFLACSITFFLGSVPLVLSAYNLRSNKFSRFWGLTLQPDAGNTPLTNKEESIHIIAQQGKA